jgi:SAM-dependent methyltransferase
MNARSVKSIQSFYDSLAPDYDLMTGLTERFSKEEQFFRSLVDTFRITTAIDAGCGTGFHSLLLSRLGVKVTAVDVSRKMLSALRKHSRQYNLPVKTAQSPFWEISERIHSSVDAIFCMGNALAHILTEGELLQSLANFYALLQPGGILVIQLVNFNRILIGKKSVQHERESGGKRFTRSYDYNGKLITFFIDIQAGGDSGNTHRKISIELNPLRSIELQGLLFRSGFTTLKQFGSIAKEPYSPGTSRDLIVLAQKIAL